MPSKKQQALTLLHASKPQDALPLLLEHCRSHPDDDEGWYFCGVAHGSINQMAEALACFRRVVTLRPDADLAHLYVAQCLQALGELEQAVQGFRAVLKRNPTMVEAHRKLGALLYDMGHPEQAEQQVRAALQGFPDDPDLLNRLGAILVNRRDYVAADSQFKQAIARRPDFADAICNRGACLRSMGRRNEAMDMLRRGLATAPDHFGLHNNLGLIYQDLRRLPESEAAFRKALSLDPESATAANNLGLSLMFQWQLGEALQWCRRAIDHDPSMAVAHSNLGLVLQAQGRIDEALLCFQRALALDPNDDKTHTNMLFCMNYLAEADPNTVFAEHKRWGETLAYPPMSLILPNPPDPERRLRIGYVSPDLRSHPVAFFFESLLGWHDASAVKTFCYAEVPNPDDITDRLRRLSHHWRDSCGMSDQDLAQRILDDGIDIAVDLAGHTGGSRLRALTYKPAPILVSWLGYPNTTGVNAIDYRLTDQWADPPGPADSLHTESLYRLPRGFLCYLPVPGCPAPGTRGADSAPTFGCYNNLSKINDSCIALWSSLMQRLPEATLVLKNNQLSDAETCALVREKFARHGIPIERLQLMGRLPSVTDHLDAHNRFDVALDTFPYNGTTTTCEALWMGVPVVTLAGATHASRVGASLLNQVGLADLVAATPAAYVDIAVALATDPKRRAHLRQTLRTRMQQAPLCDAAGFARDVETAYREMWQRWCDQRNT